MKYQSSYLVGLLVAGLAEVSHASPSPVAVAQGQANGDAIRDMEHFRMAMLAPRQQSLQAFTGALGGVAASAITNSGDPDRPFGVDGDTFVGIFQAFGRWGIE